MRLIIFINLIIVCFSGCAQKRKTLSIPAAPSSRDYLLNEIANECYTSNRFSPSQRLAFYPFNKAASIKLISFEEGGSIPVKGEVIDYDKVLEQKVLNTEQKDSLTHLLFNIGYTPTSNDGRWNTLGYKCYEPRNGILFLNKAGSAFEFIEICFACHDTRKSSESVNDGEYCTTKFDLLKNYFASHGIKYGTNGNPILGYSQIFKLDTAELVLAIKDKLAYKTHNADDLSKLNDTERALFLALNASKIYEGFNDFSGLALFYLANRETIAWKQLMC